MWYGVAYVVLFVSTLQPHTPVVCPFAGGGFHRYSVDEFWHIPHFEKVVQAQFLTAAHGNM